MKLLETSIKNDKKLKIPEIRVWCHPLEGGDDYFVVFKTFEEALKFIEKNEEAEEFPLIAFNGYEINIFDGSEEWASALNT